MLVKILLQLSPVYLTKLKYKQLPVVMVNSNLNDQRIYTIKLPTHFYKKRPSIKSLNLNVYRNLHYMALNVQKRKFHSLVAPLLKDIPKLHKINLHYDIYVNSKRKIDLMNVGSIVDKYFSDTLVSCGIIIDDNTKYIDHVSFSFKGIDTNYANVTITETETKERKSMRILLDQNDIQKALDSFVEEQNIKGSQGVTLSVDSTGKIEAEIIISNLTEDLDNKPKGKRGRPKKSLNKPKVTEIDSNVEENGSDDIFGDDKGTNSSPKEEDTSTPTKSQESKESKNLSEESQEESSDKNNSIEEEENPDTIVKKKASIFDA